MLILVRFIQIKSIAPSVGDITMGVSSDIEFIIQYNYKWWHDILNIPLNEKIN